MTQRNQHADQTNDPQRPSQAEGERDSSDQSQRKQSRRRPSSPHRAPASANNDRTNDPRRPSQAEGERDTVERETEK
ncbi:MAG: hypothetical protein ACJ8CR_07625 [Roseiflexaceae bacterium]